MRLPNCPLLTRLSIPLLAAVVWLGGCHVTLALPPRVATTAADIEAGTYAADARWKPFVEAWPQRVAAAFERLEVVTGLTFEEGARPSVKLRPFGDERLAHEVRAQIVAGRRRPVVHVNAEPLIAGVLDPDRVLLRALATAAFQDAARRHGSVPPWMVHLAATAAAGDLDERLAALNRRALAGAADVQRVDTADPAAAEPTGLAALLLLAERAQPDDVRQVLAFVADGDAPDAVIGRMVGEPGGGWIEPARILFRERLAGYDDTSWTLLARAQEAAEEAGRAGLESVLVGTLPPDVEDEILVLRARAAADEGAYEEARTILASLSQGAAAHLRDPAAALALRIRTELHAGGDAALARRLARRLERDFPRSRARAEFRRDRPLLGMEEDPQAWLATLRARIAQEGTHDLDLRTIERYARTLLLDHRAGAAQRFLADLGPRGAAPELEGLRAAVEDAQSDPSAAALSRNATRVTRWLDGDDAVSAQDIVDGGRASRAALLGAIAKGPLPRTEPSRRVEAVRLLAQVVGNGEAVDAVRQLWNLDIQRIHGDLEALAAAVPYRALSRAVPEGAGEPVRSRAMEELTLGIEHAWLVEHPDFLRSLRHPEFAVRRDALRALAADDVKLVTPAVVAFGLRDKAALMRREAITLAGKARFPALARRGLEDRAWLVREEAALVVAKLEGRRRSRQLIRVLRSDEVAAVRAAAAQGLLPHAVQDAEIMDALLATQVGEEARLRDAIATRLSEQRPLAVVRGIVRGWHRALARETPSRGYLFRTALLYQRLTEEDIGYYPGADRQELRAMLERMQAWVAARPGRPADAAGPGAIRRPTGRAR